MNKKGFTLIELLAVIVVLGIIMAIAGNAILKTKKDANEKEVESIYNMIKKLGPDVYLSEKDSINDDKVYFGTTYLTNKGYLKTKAIKNPSGGGNCSVYLLIDKSTTDMFDAYVNCPGLESFGTNPEEEASGYKPYSESSE